MNNLSSQSSYQPLQNTRNNSPIFGSQDLPISNFGSQVSIWKKIITFLVGLLAIFFGLVPRSTYCDVSVMKYMCFRHLINVGVFSVLFIVLGLCVKFLLKKGWKDIMGKYNKLYFIIMLLFVVSLLLNFLVNKYKEDNEDTVTVL